MSSQIPLIKFRITEFRDNEAWGEIKLYVRNELLLDLSKYPLGALSRQLEDWSNVVDDEERPHCFLFKHEDISLSGTFRIEPRPKLWEFTSWKELRRPPNLLELEEYLEMSRNFIHKLSRENDVQTT